MIRINVERENNIYKCKFLIIKFYFWVYVLSSVSYEELLVSRKLPDKSSLLGLPVSLAETIDTTLRIVSKHLAEREPCIVSFINPYAFDLRVGDQAYANALWQFDMVLADGIGVAKALQWLNGMSVERQSFDATSLFHPVLRQLNCMKKSVCLVGGHPGIAERALQRMKQAYPDVDFLGAQDGYRAFDETIDWVLTRNPDVVLVGMGAPIQESFLLRLKQAGFLGVGFTCGGFLDQYALDPKYYPGIVDRLELRWLYRMIKEPRRLSRRYLVQYQTFVFDLLSALLDGRRGRRLYQSHLWLAKRYARSSS